METLIYKSDQRGITDIGWLFSRHSFSFGDYYNPEMMGFGMLRVLNDDIVEPGKGFGTHPHNNMEIISIVLSGSLAHKDSMGHGSAINKDEVQVMSAGTGILHSEFNNSDSEKVNFLQLWIIPKERNIKPRYDQKYFSPDDRLNKFQTIVSGNNNGTLMINQDAYLSLSKLEDQKSISYKLNKTGNGIYIFMLSGDITFGNNNLKSRDAAAVAGIDELEIKSNGVSELLVIETPLK